MKASTIQKRGKENADEQLYSSPKSDTPGLNADSSAQPSTISPSSCSPGRSVQGRDGSTSKPYHQNWTGGPLRSLSIFTGSLYEMPGLT
jgi:hypothetical protein